MLEIYEINPDVKIVFLVRSPIERAWSQFRFSRRNLSTLKIDDYDFEEFRDFILHPKQQLRSNILRTLNIYEKV